MGAPPEGTYMCVCSMEAGPGWHSQPCSLASSKLLLKLSKALDSFLIRPSQLS